MTSPTINRLNEWFDSIAGDYTAKDEVAKFIAAERSAHPADIAALANALLESALLSAASARRRGQLATARQAAIRGAVIAGAESIAAGESSGLLGERHVVSEDGTTRLAADMTGSDHNFVAGHYETQSKRSDFFAAFHRAVAKKVGAQRTGDVYTADAYTALYRNIETMKLRRRRSNAA